MTAVDDDDVLMLKDEIKKLKYDFMENDIYYDGEMNVLKKSCVDEMKELRERVLYLEKVPMYLEWMKSGYKVTRHIPARDLVKMIEFGHPIESMSTYMRAEIGCENSWEVLASEEELMELCFSVAKMPVRNSNDDLVCVLFARIYGGIDENQGEEYLYYKKIENFQKYRDSVSSSHKSLYTNYFDRMEKVLKALYEAKLLR